MRFLFLSNLIIKNRNLFITVFLFFIFFLSLAPRLYTLYEPYLLEADPFIFYRQAEIVLSGEKPERCLYVQRSDCLPMALLSLTNIMKTDLSTGS